jgi:hypothetical protein
VHSGDAALRCALYHACANHPTAEVSAPRIGDLVPGRCRRGDRYLVAC